MQRTRDDCCKAADVVPVELLSLGGVADPRIASDDVLHQHLPTVNEVLLTSAALVAPLRPDDLHHDAGRMVWPIRQLRF